jgi:hypothetical protein
VVAAVVLGLVLRAGESLAWIYSEHRDIAVLALVGLDAERRSTIDGMWAEARMGHEDRMCATAAEPVQGEKPSCFDWAAWSAVAGDHTCSGQALVTTPDSSPWGVVRKAYPPSPRNRLDKSLVRSRAVPPDAA